MDTKEQMCFSIDFLKATSRTNNLLLLFLMGENRELDGYFPLFDKVRICPRLNNTQTAAGDLKPAGSLWPGVSINLGLYRDCVCSSPLPGGCQDVCAQFKQLKKRKEIRGSRGSR